MTIVPRGGRFGAKVWDRGKGSYRWLGTFDTPEEAARAEEDATLTAGKQSPTVEQWGRVWLADYPRPAESSRRTYRYAVATIVASLGKQCLHEITRPEARRIAEHDWPRGTTRVARTMWGDAVRDGVCEINPWTNLRLETPRGRKDIDALTEEEVETLGEIALRVHGDYGLEARAIIMVGYYTDLRPAEICALKLSDLDLKAQELTAIDSRVGTNGVKRPKNGLGRRIVLPPQAIEAIRAMPQTIGDGLLFHSKRGKLLNKSNLAYVWREVRAAWLAEGRRHIVPYELRHAGATALIEKGVAVGDVAFQLGHKDGGRLVMELYGHPGEAQIRERLKEAHASRDGRTRRVA
jgi:integrase